MDYKHVFDNQRFPLFVASSTFTGFAPPKLHNTGRVTPSSKQQTSTKTPHRLQKAKATEKRTLIVEELRGSITHDDLLLTKFFPALQLRRPLPESTRSPFRPYFPVLRHSRSLQLRKEGPPSRGELLLRELSDKYGGMMRKSARAIDNRRHAISKGWKDIPSPPVGKEPSIPEKRIATSFTHILNSIIHCLGLQDTQLAIDLQNIGLPTRDGGVLKPDIFLWRRNADVRSAFPCLSKSSPSVPKSERDQRDAMRQYGHDFWQWCSILIEVKTDRERGFNKDDVLFQLGTYVREVLASQPNRRYLPSLIVTESTLEFVVWDRAGVLISPRMDYHVEAGGLCEILASILEWDDEKLGFDPSMFYDAQELHIRTREASGCIEYIVDKEFFRQYTVLGHASTCWLAHRLDNNAAHYIIVDLWNEGGIARGQAIRSRIENAQLGGAELDVRTLLDHLEEVQIIGKDGPHKDSILHNRRTAFVRGVPNLVHVRTVSVSRSNCRLLETYTDIKDLLEALHDIIKLHGELYLNAQVSHDALAPWNLLLQPGAPPGSRGTIVDFSLARVEGTLGVYSHLADLKSFYYILSSTLMKTGHTISPQPTWPRSSWVRNDYDHDPLTKQVDLREASSSPAHTSLERLMERLRGFFRRRDELLRNQIFSSRPDPRADYAEFVNFFARALEELENPEEVHGVVEPRLGSKRAGSPKHKDDHPPKRYRLGTSFDNSSPFAESSEGTVGDDEGSTLLTGGISIIG